MLNIIDINFNDHEINWEPEDLSDFEEWIEVNVGEEGFGNLYQVHLCTVNSIKNINKKQHLFMIEKWAELNDLIVQLNNFIETKLISNPNEDPYYVLSKFWNWEYEAYSS